MTDMLLLSLRSIFYPGYSNFVVKLFTDEKLIHDSIVKQEAKAESKSFVSLIHSKRRELEKDIPILSLQSRLNNESRTIL